MVDAIWDFDELSGETVAAADVLAAPENANSMITAALTKAAGPAPEPAAVGGVHVDLPGGLHWNGALLRTAEIRELTGADEEYLDRVGDNAIRWVTALLERAVVRIGPYPATPEMIRALLIGDRDALVLGIRIATFGATLEYRQLICPRCDERVDVSVDLSTVDPGALDEPQVEHAYRVPTSHGEAVVVLPTGAAQEQILANSRATVAERNSSLLRFCVRSIGGVAVSAEDVLTMPMRDRRALIRWLVETQPGPRLDETSFVHSACGEEVRLPISVPELFRSA